MPGRRRHLEARSLTIASALWLLVLAGCAGTAPAPRRAEAPADGADHDLMLADLYLDGIEVGRIPVTIELDEARDYRVTTAADRAGPTFVLHAERPAAIVTLDAIAGRLVALDESTGVWVPLDPVGSEEPAAASGDEASGSEVVRVAEDQDEGDPDPHTGYHHGGESDSPFGEIQFPLIVRLSNGLVVRARSISCVGGSCGIVPVEGPDIRVDDLWIFTIESATGLSLTSYVMREGHSVP